MYLPGSGCSAGCTVHGSTGESFGGPSPDARIRTDVTPRSASRSISRESRARSPPGQTSQPMCIAAHRLAPMKANGLPRNM